MVVSLVYIFLVESLFPWTMFVATVKYMYNIRLEILRFRCSSVMMEYIKAIALILIAFQHSQELRSFIRGKYLCKI